MGWLSYMHHTSCYMNITCIQQATIKQAHAWMAATYRRCCIVSFISRGKFHKFHQLINAHENVTLEMFTNNMHLRITAFDNLWKISPLKITHYTVVSRHAHNITHMCTTSVTVFQLFIPVKAVLIYTQGLKYTLGSAAE